MGDGYRVFLINSKEKNLPNFGFFLFFVYCTTAACIKAAAAAVKIL